MYREKGKRLNELVSDYTVIDIETTSRDVLTAQIIELAALKIRNKQVVDKFSTLVNPNIPIPIEISKLTNITNEMVHKAPCLKDALQRFIDFISDDIIVGHNIVTFDSCVIYDKAIAELGINFKNNMLDTLYIARYTDLKCVDYKLSTLTSMLGINNESAHRALSDCYAEYELYEKLRPMYDKSKAPRSNNYSKKKKPKFSDKTLALRELNDMLSSLYVDEEFEIYYWDELCDIKDFIDENDDLIGNYPYNETKLITDQINETTAYSTNALADIIAELKNLSTPNFATDDSEKNIIVKDKNIVLTGEFSKGSKADITAMLTALGANVKEKANPSGKTDILIVGALGSQDWICGNYGGKIKKAMELNAKGAGIQIIGEKDFFEKLGENQ